MPHTPGPWTLERRSATIALIGAVPRNDRHILGEIYGATTLGETTWHDNARLIAAAPTLLAACKGMLAVCTTHDRDTIEALKKIEAAIALAEKGTSS